MLRFGCHLPFSPQSKHLWSNKNKRPHVTPVATHPARIWAEILRRPQKGSGIVSFYHASVTYGKSNESLVEKTEEDDGTDHHAAYETKGPAGPQDGVNLGHEDGSQSPGPAPRCRQPAHVDALQTVQKCNGCLLGRFQLQNSDRPEAWVRGLSSTACRT